MPPNLTSSLKKLNDHADVNLISVDELGIETALLLQENLDRQGEWVIVAADRVPVQSERIQPVSFLGLKTRTGRKGHGFLPVC